MSLLKYCKKKTKVLPMPEQADIGRRETEEANNRVEKLTTCSTILTYRNGFVKAGITAAIVDPPSFTNK